MKLEDVIVIQSDAFHALIDEIYVRVKAENNLPEEDQWISPQEAMKMLRISSDQTLKKIRDRGDIVFSKPTGGIVLYERQSILDYIERHVKNRF